MVVVVLSLVTVLYLPVSYVFIHIFSYTLALAGNCQLCLIPLRNLRITSYISVMVKIDVMVGKQNH